MSEQDQQPGVVPSETAGTGSVAALTPPDGLEVLTAATDDVPRQREGLELLVVPDEAAADGETPPQAPGPLRHARGRRARRALVVLAVLAGLLVVGLGAGAWWVRDFTQELDRNIERFGDPFAPLPEAQRPAKPAAAAKAMNILLLGSDSRTSAGDPDQWVAGAQRTDAIMVLHVDQARKNVSVVSIPRDSWVRIPGHGTAKINAAFSWGGPSLMVRTVEAYTNVRIDHVVIVDFEGFQQLTDSLGGVTITVPKDTHDERGSFAAGTQRMDGATALRYVRQRHNLPGGDFDRIHRQQNWIRAIMTEAMAHRRPSDVGTVTEALQDVTSAVATDDGFSFDVMRDLAWSLRSVRAGDVRFLTAPVAGTGWSPDRRQAIVKLDDDANRELWRSVKDDALGDWIATHEPALLGTTVR
ncbi:MAG: LCP family protein [Kineosporiaceae bacterium]